MTQTPPHPHAAIRAAHEVSGQDTATLGRDDLSPIIAREGWPVIGVLFLMALAISAICHWFLPRPVGLPISAIGLLVVLWSLWFFRDPPRVAPAGALFVAPADGVVCAVGPAVPPPELGFPGPVPRISIFMDIFSVHVNRAPCQATVQAVHYRPGKFFNASFDKASEHNERCSLRLALPDGRSAACIQIAGLIARRIVCRVKPGDALRTGQRFGMIRFGSRVDVYLPADVAPAVALGQKTIAGRTILAAAPETH